MLKASKVEVFNRWKHIEIGQIKINSNNTCNNEGNVMAIKGVFQDWAGIWIKGFYHNLYIGGVISLELWGILDGLKLAWQLRYREIWLEPTSAEALALVKHGCPKDNPKYHLVVAIEEILGKD